MGQMLDLMTSKNKRNHTQRLINTDQHTYRLKFRQTDVRNWWNWILSSTSPVSFIIFLLSFLSLSYLLFSSSQIYLLSSTAYCFISSPLPSYSHFLLLLLFLLLLFLLLLLLLLLLVMPVESYHKDDLSVLMLILSERRNSVFMSVETINSRLNPTPTTLSQFAPTCGEVCGRVARRVEKRSCCLVEE